MTAPALLAVLWVALAAAGADRHAAVGDYVVVYGSILGCSGFPGVIAVPKVTDDGVIELSQLPPIDALNRNSEEIRGRLSTAIAKMRARHDAPQSVQIEILSAEEYPTIRERYLASLRYRAEGRCQQPSEPNEKLPKEWQHFDFYDWSRMAQVESAQPIVRPG